MARAETSRSPSQSANNCTIPPAFSLVDDIAGNSVQIQILKKLIDVVASSDAAVLIIGETGTGKELFARRLHSASNRRAQAFVAINCGAIPDSLVESELFGFEKGAFTGASSRKQGRLAEADGGTLFLDEIGDLSPTAQAKLLRVLEQKEVQPLGSGAVRVLDFRVVAATNRDLAQLATEGKFRQDLLFRLNVIQIDIPPLRERIPDILLIANHFLKKLSSRYGRAAPRLTPGAERRLGRQPWLGNARELRNVMERIFLLSESSDITEDDVSRMCESGIRWRVGTPSGHATKEPNQSKTEPHDRVARTQHRPLQMESSDTSELERLRGALEQTKWNKSKAAELLSCSRMTIHRKIVQYELSPPRGGPTEEAIGCD